MNPSRLILRVLFGFFVPAILRKMVRPSRRELAVTRTTCALQIEQLSMNEMPCGPSRNPLKHVLGRLAAQPVTDPIIVIRSCVNYLVCGECLLDAKFSFIVDLLGVLAVGIPLRAQTDARYGIAESKDVMVAMRDGSQTRC